MRRASRGMGYDVAWATETLKNKTKERVRYPEIDNLNRFPKLGATMASWFRYR